MSDSASELYELLLTGDRRATARLISMVEDADPGSSQALSLIYQHTGHAHIIGLTGSPGSGKSTLAGALTTRYRKMGRTVGIIAVDPTSPFTGGALLGDRVRMQELTGDPGIFIRSMGSRGALGGLAAATNEAIDVLDASGKDIVIVETVGAGQVEVEVMKYAHTCCVVTMPGAGDEIQAIKAGILEIADIFVVNKADREGCNRTVYDLESMIETGPGCRDDWKPVVLATVALEGVGVDELIEMIDAHKRHLEESGAMERKALQRMKAQLLAVLEQEVSRGAADALSGEAGMDIVSRMASREIDPRAGARELLRKMYPPGT